MGSSKNLAQLRNCFLCLKFVFDSSNDNMYVTELPKNMEFSICYMKNTKLKLGAKNTLKKEMYFLDFLLINTL